MRPTARAAHVAIGLLLAPALIAGCSPAARLERRIDRCGLPDLIEDRSGDLGVLYRPTDLGKPLWGTTDETFFYYLDEREVIRFAPWRFARKQPMTDATTGWVEYALRRMPD